MRPVILTTLTVKLVRAAHSELLSCLLACYNPPMTSPHLPLSPRAYRLGGVVVKKTWRISLDVDDVLAEVNRVWLARYNRLHNYNYPLSAITDWDFSSIQSTPAEMLPLYDLVWNEESDLIQCLVDVQLVAQLAQLAEVHLVTTRTPVTVAALQQWLQKHELGAYDLVRNEHLRSKADLNYDIYIDDDPKLATTIAERPAQTLFLVDKFWNQTARTAGDPMGPPNVRRVPNTNLAILATIAQIAPTTPPSL